MDFVDGRFDLREVQTLEGHTDRVWSLAWNPATGVAGVPAMFVSCSGDKTVRVWEEQPRSGADSSWECKAVLDETHTRTVRSCAWSPSGKLLATGSFDATTAIWENVGGDFECVSTLEGHENEVKSVSWNASGNLLATCGRDKTVWIWEVQAGNEFECVAVLQGHTQDVKMVQWHPTTDVLFSCSYDNSIKIWADLGGNDDWECAQTIKEDNNGHSSTVWAISFNSSGDKMVTSSDDLTLKIWETDMLEIMQSGEGFATCLIMKMIELRSDKPILDIKADGDELVRVTCVKSLGKYRRHACTIAGHHDRTIFSVHWSREGIIASGAADDAIRFFVENEDKNGLVDGPMYKLLLKEDKAHDMDVNSVQWSSGVRRLLASGSDDGTVKIWELASQPC